MKKILIALLLVSVNSYAVETREKELESEYIGTSQNCDIYRVNVGLLTYIYLSKCHDVSESSTKTNGKSPKSNLTYMENDTRN